MLGIYKTKTIWVHSRLSLANRSFQLARIRVFLRDVLWEMQICSYTYPHVY